MLDEQKLDMIRAFATPLGPERARSVARKAVELHTTGAPIALQQDGKTPRSKGGIFQKLAMKEKMSLRKEQEEAKRQKTIAGEPSNVDAITEASYGGRRAYQTPAAT